MGEQPRPAQDREETRLCSPLGGGSIHHGVPVSVAFKTAPAKRNVSEGKRSQVELRPQGLRSGGTWTGSLSPTV